MLTAGLPLQNPTATSVNEVLDALGWERRELARVLGVSRRTVKRWCESKPPPRAAWFGILWVRDRELSARS